MEATDSFKSLDKIYKLYSIQLLHTHGTQWYRNWGGESYSGDMPYSIAVVKDNLFSDLFFIHKYSHSL